MTLADRFFAYAAAFEQSFLDDDWSRIEPFFAADAIYESLGEAPFAGRWSGRDAILASFKRSLDAFDRRFASRRLEILEGPREAADSVWIRWAAVYSVPGAPHLRIEGEERAVYAGDRIRLLEDTIPADVAARTSAYLTEHARALRPGGGRTQR